MATFGEIREDAVLSQDEDKSALISGSSIASKPKAEPDFDENGQPVFGRASAPSAPAPINMTPNPPIIDTRTALLLAAIALLTLCACVYLVYFRHGA